MRRSPRLSGVATEAQNQLELVGLINPASSPRLLHEAFHG
jgi:hypothetical protein